MNYIALTIGPIYETMSYCKKTRELWAGSYFFSYFMKSLIQILYEDKEIDIEFIIPYVDGDTLGKHFEVGIFHDRFIAKSSLEKDKLKSLIENRISEILYYLSLFIGNPNSKLDDIMKKKPKFEEKNSTYIALKAYLQYSYIIANETELKISANKENIVFTIDSILDTMELQNSFDFHNSTKKFHISKKDYKNPPLGDVNPVAKLQYQAQRLKNEVSQSNLRFKSIPEIALSSILESKTFKEFNYELFKNEDDLEKYEAFYKEFDKDEDFKPHHKYFAVISADGDRMGKTIRTIYNENPDNITKLSKSIYDYITRDKSLAKIFDEFGGMLIYAGGDDLLGFAPIFGKDEKTIFELLENLSDRFKDNIGNDVSLSFGVSINYYKFPMIEAIKKAHYLLFDKAKSYNTEEKSGALAISLVKHSGQTFDGEFFLGDEVYDAYKKLFKDELSQKIKLPHSLQYSLKQFEALIMDIFASHNDIANNKIDALFENLIKDESHTSQAQDALDELKSYIKLFKPSNENEFNRLITQLAIIKFLRGDR